MELFDAEILAKQLISEYVPHYSFAWHNKKTVYGTCNVRTKTIYLSRPLTQLCTEKVVRDTIMHEIAHAMHPKDGHGRHWKLQMIRFGLSPDRCLNEDAKGIDKSSISNWQGTCPGCGKLSYGIRKPRVMRSCGPCGNGKYNENYVLTWKRI